MSPAFPLWIKVSFSQLPGVLSVGSYRPAEDSSLAKQAALYRVISSTQGKPTSNGWMTSRYRVKSSCLNLEESLKIHSCSRHALKDLMRLLKPTQFHCPFCPVLCPSLPYRCCFLLQSSMILLHATLSVSESLLWGTWPKTCLRFPVASTPSFSLWWAIEAGAYKGECHDYPTRQIPRWISFLLK